jgi:hypothetical protein
MVLSPMDVAILLCGRTMVFRSRISVGVMADGSTSCKLIKTSCSRFQIAELKWVTRVTHILQMILTGIGLFELFRIWLFPTIDAHCNGNPMNLPSFLSNPVWTRCSKFDGSDICGFFFFFENMSPVSGALCNLFCRAGTTLDEFLLPLPRQRSGPFGSTLLSQCSGMF